jgi:hypothetical protein
MKVTDLFKELLPWPPAPWVRSVVSLAATVALALLAGVDDSQELAVLIAGAWGLSALLHEVGAVLSIISDNFKQQVILRSANRRR